MFIEQLTEEVKIHRQADYDISPLILNRWSPRSMSGEVLTDDELLPLFEAARWAPSSYNNQPWRFIMARRQSSDVFSRFMNLLTSGNQAWAKDAAFLVVILSKKTFDYNGKPSITHAFDTGAAWENLAVEGARRGLAVHGMEGFDYERARQELHIPEGYDVHAMIAIGKRGPKDKLPEQAQAMEQPNGRKALKEILFEGQFEE